MPANFWKWVTKWEQELWSDMSSKVGAIVVVWGRRTIVARENFDKEHEI